MKHMKKLLVVVAALVMAMAMSSVAWAKAGDTHTISLGEGDTHTYDVYQILTGDLSGNTLSNVAWGSSVNTPDAAGKINSKTAAEFAESLEGLAGVDAVAEVGKYFTADPAETTSPKKVGTLGGDNKSLEVVEGYYVMVDVTDPLKHDAVTDTKALNVIKLVKDVTVDKKWSTSSDVKTIVADTLGKDDGANTYNPGRDNDNVSIGDVVTFNIAANVPENTDKFKEGTFFFVITDKLSDGLTFNDDIAVYLGDATEPLPSSAYTVQKDVNGNTFEVGLKNAWSEQYRGKTINVRYTATLNKNAVIGDAGNPNTSNVEFSNDPNKTYNGTPEDENHPGFPDSNKEVPTGVTPDSKTITYSTGIEILKVDENGEPLTGATFEISGQSAKIVVTKTEVFVVDDEKGTYYKLNNGTYTMTAPTTENEMIPAEKGATKGYVVDPEATGEGVITIGETNYRPYVPNTDAGKDLYVLKEGSADAYADNHKYVKTVTENAVDNKPTDHKMAQAVDENGLARFDGLGAGSYTLTETVTPAGYNTIAPVELQVTYTENGEAKFTVTGGNAKYEDGVVKIKVVNKKGAELPSTGGMGTTVLYIVGGIMVLLAVVFLITKKRVANKRNDRDMI